MGGEVGVVPRAGKRHSAGSRVAQDGVLPCAVGRVEPVEEEVALVGDAGGGQVGVAVFKLEDEHVVVSSVKAERVADGAAAVDGERAARLVGELDAAFVAGDAAA